MWRPLFLKCMILDHKLQRMFNDFKIGQLNSERPLHQTAVNINNIIILIMHRVVHKAWEVNVRPKMMMTKGGLDGIITIITITILIIDRVVHKAWDVNTKPCPPPCNTGAAT